jgi:hypothetical protein|tara:strand:- start:1220 stop:1396 length:177 start_codon:yes stop_codon:yes gene_type:complete
MNRLSIHNVENIKVTTEDFQTFKTVTVTVTDEHNKDFQLQLFTDVKFVPNMEIVDEYS